MHEVERCKISEKRTPVSVGGIAISRLSPVPFRDLWRHEARGFSSWLSENRDYLEEVVGISLSLVEQESASGDFSKESIHRGWS